MLFCSTVVFYFISHRCQNIHKCLSVYRGVCKCTCVCVERERERTKRTKFLKREKIIQEKMLHKKDTQSFVSYLEIFA